MSTDPYPEVTVDESGIVPPQSGRTQEWPKKIRTLTATELDRLTIDSAGRFYWDGRLVNYEPPDQPKAPAADKPTDPLDSDAMEAMERALDEHGEQKPAEHAEGSDQQHSDETQAHAAHLHESRAERDALDLDMTRPAPHHHEAPVAAMPETMIVPPTVVAPERMRLKMSAWQSFGAIVVVLGVLVCASGIAAYGFVAAHDWGCRTGLIQSYCPATPAGRPPARSDIPA